MRQLLPVVLLVFSLFPMAGCGGKSHSSMSPAEQEALTKNLEGVAFLYREYTLENGKSPASWDELSRFVIDVEAEVDLQSVKNAGYTVNWNLSVDEITGSGADQVAIAQAGADSPTAYADGGVK